MAILSLENHVELGANVPFLARPRVRGPSPVAATRQRVGAGHHDVLVLHVLVLVEERVVVRLVRVALDGLDVHIVVVVEVVLGKRFAPGARRGRVYPSSHLS